MTAKASPGPPNRLANSGSPYLLAHAHNPVDWYPWSEEAFRRAEVENKPVFLSIGYSTCHWCHVMEAESFNDREVADLMNETFVCVKVDREERPDLDHIYMAVCQQLTGSGGWPLTIIMTPDRKPFFAGTYFPRGGGAGRTGMLELIPQVRDLWQDSRHKAEAVAGEIVSSLRDALAPQPASSHGTDLGSRAYAILSGRFDQRHGGFGSAPKFPVPANLLFLLRHWHRTGEERALEMVTRTLKAMRMGGIYDHLGYGIHRYSTDARWFAPHFEKMLYDQALVSMACTEAYGATGDEQFRSTAMEIFSYVLTRMTSPEGAFYSAEDADSEGEEGRFYTWTSAEVDEVLDDQERAFARAFYNIHEGGNFSGGHGVPPGRNILYNDLDAPSPPGAPVPGPGAVAALRERVRNKLLTAREKRPRPFLDTKIMTDWNGFMIAALARASWAFEDQSLARKAEQAMSFLMERMRGDDGRLLHVRYDDNDRVGAYLDDYACLLWAQTELYQATFHPRHLENAVSTADEMVRLFWDAADGGFFFSPGGEDTLSMRHKFAFDAAIPSGNAIAAANLLRLGRLTGRTDYGEKVASLALTFGGTMEPYPAAFIHLVSALAAGGPAPEVVIAGDPDGPDTLRMISALRRRYLPDAVVAVVPAGAGSRDLTRLIPWAADMRPLNGKAAAYVCRDFSCQAPTTDPEEMISHILGRGGQNP